MKLAASLALVAVAFAQEVDRTKPPDTPAVPSFRMPPLSEHTLANGLRVVTVRDSRLPLITLRLGFQAGAKFDPADQIGLSETVAALLKEGTSRRSARQIAEQMAEIGGSIEAVSGPDSITVNASALSEHATALLDLIADITQNPAFPEEELKLRKQNRVQELLAQRADASTLAEEKFHAVLFGPHPYAHMLPTAATLERITREALAQFHRRFLVPNNAVLLLVGDLPPEAKLYAWIQSYFGKWAKGNPPPSIPGKFPAPKRSLILVDRPGSVQADIRIGKVSVDRKNPDYFPLVVANSILGGGASSRLFSSFREQKGYAYDVHSTQSARRVGGLFEVVTQVRNEVLPQAIEDLLAEMRKISSQPVAKQELSNVKNYLAGAFVIRLETQSGLADQLAMVKLMDLPGDYLETYVTRVRSVEPDGVLKVAKKYIHPDDAAIVVVGDAAKIAPALERLGKLTIEKTP